MTVQNPNAIYSCVNLSDAYAPTEIKRQSVCLDGDIGTILKTVSWNLAGIATPAEPVNGK